jgi:hypothetical protein
MMRLITIAPMAATASPHCTCVRKLMDLYAMLKKGGCHATDDANADSDVDGREVLVLLFPDGVGAVPAWHAPACSWAGIDRDRGRSWPSRTLASSCLCLRPPGSCS